MAQNIISERWTHIPVPSAVLQSGIVDSPLATYNTSILEAGGERKADTDIPGNVPNSFNPADTVLVRRIRLYSPLQGLGLAGGMSTNAYPDIVLYALRKKPNTQGYSYQHIRLQNGVSLGEWVDVNQTLNAEGLGGDQEFPWQLSWSLASAMSLDSSRCASSLIGSAMVAFQIQVDIAHTLPSEFVQY